jgi:hypothetical protein
LAGNRYAMHAPFPGRVKWRLILFRDDRSEPVLTANVVNAVHYDAPSAPRNLALSGAAVRKKDSS